MKEPRRKFSYKRPFDVTVLAVAHLFPLLLPVWILLWTVIPLAVWLQDRGPIFFRQKRIGKNGRPFTFLKFRTMVPGAEVVSLVTKGNDPRVTRIGGLLRRTAMDELPQVVNILRGEMSFVGPRALPTEMHLDAVKEDPRFINRTTIMPGLTGIAQLYLPRHCSPRRRLGYDMLYKRKANIWLDIGLMFRAAWNTLTGSWGIGVRSTDTE